MSFLVLKESDRIPLLAVGISVIFLFCVTAGALLMNHMILTKWGIDEEQSQERTNQIPVYHIDEKTLHEIVLSTHPNSVVYVGIWGEKTASEIRAGAKE